MLSIPKALILLLWGLVIGSEATKQNFLAKSISNGFTDSQAIDACYTLGYCTLTTGCCNGNGQCQASNATTASCVCSTPQECRSQLSPASYGTYSSPGGGTPSQSCTIPPTGCCASGSDDLSFANLGGCHLNTADATTMDPEVGAQGNLLVRTGSANFADGYSTSQISTSEINSIVTNLTSASRGVAFTSGNMLGLGFLEFAVKDIVDYEYDYTVSTPPLGPNNVTYPALKWQNNTGIVAGSTTIPKEFANNASAVIDCGPLYSWSHRLLYPGSSNVTGPYLDLTDAMTHWNLTHHMPLEFLVALRYYHAYHNFVARNLEEFFCGQNSTKTAITNNCTVRTTNGSEWATDQDWQDFIFEQARRSTLRFSQVLLQTSVLQIALEYYDPSVSRSGMDGYYDADFSLYWRRDETLVSYVGDYFACCQFPRINNYSDWSGDLTRTKLAHHIQAGLDYLISLRNPNINTSASSLLTGDCNGIQVGMYNGDLPTTVIQLSHTPLQRYGSQIQSVYSADLALQLYRMGELGLGSYNTHINGLANSPSAAPSDTNLYFGSQIEWYSGRQYHNTIASVALASIVEIGDVTFDNVDRTGYFHYNLDNYVADGNRFHPSPFISILSSPPQNCYLDPLSGVCSDLAYMASYFVSGNSLFVETQGLYETIGLTYGSTILAFLEASSWDPVTGDFTERQPIQYQLIGDFLNVIFYNWDGTNTFVVKQSDSDTYLLPNQFTDSLPTNIAWTNINWDGWCAATPAFKDGDACRSDGEIFSGTDWCLWYWQNL